MLAHVYSLRNHLARWYDLIGQIECEREYAYYCEWEIENRQRPIKATDSGPRHGRAWHGISWHGIAVPWDVLLFCAAASERVQTSAHIHKNLATSNSSNRAHENIKVLSEN